MATPKQRQAARKNVKRAQAGARQKKTITRLSKKTRSALGREGAKAAARPRGAWCGPPLGGRGVGRGAGAAPRPRAASFGPPVWVTGETPVLVLSELPDDRATTTIAPAMARNAPTITISRLERTLRRTGTWGWAMSDMWTSVGRDG